MKINDLPAIMGTVMIVAGSLCRHYTRLRTRAVEKSVQAGIFDVVGAVLLGCRYCTHAT